MDLQRAYATLGVSSEWSLEDIKTRYRARARLLHPDRAAEDSALSLEAGRAMAEVNEAWATVTRLHGACDPLSAARGASAHTETPRSAPPTRDPAEGECDLCGSKPAAGITLRQSQGRIIYRRKMESTLDLCQTCGRSMFREIQATNLVQGWWGVISIFATVAYLVQNAAQVRQHDRKTMGSVSRDPAVNSPLPTRPPLTRPVLGRLGPWVAMSFAGLLLFAFIAATVDPAYNGGSADSDGGQTTGDGSCLTSAGLVTDCTGTDAYWVITHDVTSPDQCDVNEESFSSSDGRMFCAGLR